jgi:Flp pilus assembly pilin Flp
VDLPEPRPVNEVIDQIIRENRPSEWVCYGLIVVFVAVGVVVIIWGCVKESAPLAAVGGIPVVLFWPALNAARAIRKENMLLRSLEIPLGLATTVSEAADELRKAFANIIMR